MKNLVLVFSFLLVTGSLLATDPPTDSNTPASFEVTDFQEVLRKADFYRGGQVKGISWSVDVIDKERGQVIDELTLFVEATAEGERQFSLVNFQAPKKYEGQKFLVRDNNMWFIKPGLRAPVPISGRERLTGQASNTDVSSVNYYHDYEISNTADGQQNGEDCWILSLKAKNKLVNYARIEYWVSKSRNQGVKAEYYGTSGKQIKYAEFEYNNKVNYQGESYDFISKAVIYDGINPGNHTDLELTNIQFPDFESAKFQRNNM